jgi:putative ABC transport system substrate-binding protein
MRRRDFTAALGSAAVAWPLAALAQKSPLPIVGVLGLASPEPNAPFTAWFVRGLKEAGFAEGQNVAIEYRWAEAQYDRLQALAADLVRRRVAVIFTSGGSPPLRAAMSATSSIPIVFSLGFDPVKQGIVASINRPTGNVTGVTFAYISLGSKRVDLLRELVPKAGLVALLVNPNSEASLAEQRQLESLSSPTTLQFLVVTAKSAEDIEAAFNKIVQQQATHWWWLLILCS